MWRVVPPQGAPSPSLISCPNTYTVTHGLVQASWSFNLHSLSNYSGLFFEGVCIGKDLNYQHLGLDWAHGKDHPAIRIRKGFIYGVPGTLYILPC